MGIYDNPPPHDHHYHHYDHDQHHHDHGPPHDHHCIVRMGGSGVGRQEATLASCGTAAQCPFPPAKDRGVGLPLVWVFVLRIELKPSLMMMSRTWTWTCHEHNTGEI